MKILKTKNLEKHFDGVYAVDKLTLSFEQAKLTSIIGPNGSGKTTLINVLSGVLPIDGGTVILEGKGDYKSIKPHDSPDLGITRTFQNVRLFEQMTVLDNILVVLTRRSVLEAIFEKDKQGHVDQALDILERVGLSDKKDALASELSYGQRKLLEIGRVLGMNVEIILLDEPFAGLFPEMIKNIVEIIEELKQSGKTIILIEHNMDLIRQLSDYVFVMDEGKLLAEGKPNEVLAKREVIEAYLGE